jgi:hypothetical protein
MVLKCEKVVIHEDFESHEPEAEVWVSIGNDINLK